MSFVILLLLAVAALGALLLYRGGRGVAVDDHPLCRRCGFDLTGRPEGVERCSECGADLGAPRAILIGHRATRQKLVAAGALLLVIGLGSAGAAMWAAGSQTNWQQYKPLWWLVRETDDVDRAVSKAALAELALRLGAGKLSDAQILRLADRALAIQGDATKAWSTEWGDLVESARAINKLPDDRWRKYAEQAPNFALQVRPEVRKGDRIPLWIRSMPARIGSRTQFYVRYERASRTWDVGPVRLEPEGSGGGGSGISATGGGATGTSLDVAKFLDRLPPGKHVVKLSQTITIQTSYDDQAQPIATRRIDLAASFDLLPPDRPTVKVVSDPSVRAAVERAITCSEVKPYGSSVSIQMDVKPRPVGVAYQVYLRTPDGKEHAGGTFAAPARKSGGFSFGGKAPELTAPTVDLVLRPSTDAAIGTTDVFEMWDGVIVLEDVPVKQNPPEGKSE